MFYNNLSDYYKELSCSILFLFINFYLPFVNKFIKRIFSYTNLNPNFNPNLIHHVNCFLFAYHIIQWIYSI